MTDNTTAAAPGTTPGPRPGLRERQKAQTRHDIRMAALDLFEKQGYETTTVAQIADAANVSHTTFFRYFQSKEQVMISDDLDQQRENILTSVEPGLDHFDLVRKLMLGLYAVVMDDPWAANPDRHRILHEEPALRTAYQLESDRIISEATAHAAAYLGLDPDHPPLRVFIAAVSGVMFHLVDQADDGMADLEDCLAALDLMQRGFPL